MAPTRLAYVTHPSLSLGATLEFSRLTGDASVSECFRFDVTTLSDSPDIDPLDLLGQDVTVTVHTNALDPDQARHFSGIVDGVRFAGNDESGLFRYILTLRPRLWMLSKARDNRIFQEMSVVDILCTILDEAGFGDYELRLTGAYEPRTYCVQYGETTLDFMQRLMEHEGIFWFHICDDGTHTLVLTDTLGQLEPHPDLPKLRFEPGAPDALRGPGVITRWDMTASALTGTHTQTDYDFEKPSADLVTQASEPRDHPLSDMERYDYPGHYTTTARGQTLTDLRWEEGQALFCDAEAHSTASLPQPGHLFTLTDYPRDEENNTYALLAASYDVWDDQYGAAQGKGDPSGFAAIWRAVPATARWRPARRTPRPVMRGPQTAQVVGPGGEEIYTDEYSRVKVQFHWDRVGTRDENSSCWVRVSSAWAGSGWGFIQIPRIGQEVIVDFLEGDPDQPIITGRVYNAEQMPPYGLPGEATKSGWKSNSSKGGGGWNELMFEDAAGSELVYFQAQKDHDELVKNNETRHIGNDWSEDVVHDATQWVGHDRAETVDNCKTTHVKVDRTVNIDHDDTETVGNNRALTVGVNETISVGMNSTETIGVNHTQSVGANQTVTVSANRVDTVAINEARTVGLAQATTVGASRQVSVGIDQSHDVGKSDSTSVGSDQALTVGKDQTVSVGANQTLSVGKDATASVGKNWAVSVAESAGIDAGKDLTISAADSLTLTCGKSKIVMKKDGTITIEGKDISVKGSGKITAKASSDVQIKGSKVKMN